MNAYFYWVLLLLILASLLIIYLVLKQNSQVSLVGKEDLIGQEGEARTDLKPKGSILVEGELWQVKSLSGEIKKGEKVKVVGMKKFTLQVEKINEEV